MKVRKLEGEIMTREEAKEYLINVSYMCGYTGVDDLTISDGEKMREAIEVLEQTGHWIQKRYVGNDKYNFECSVCHNIDTHSKFVQVKHVKYCWNCGTRMDVENDE